MEVGCSLKKQAAHIKRGPREVVEVKADRGATARHYLRLKSGPGVFSEQAPITSS